MKQTQKHILYSVVCYHCHTSHFNDGSIMMWPSRQTAIDAALANGWDIHLRRLYCPRCIANQQHLPPTYRKKK